MLYIFTDEAYDGLNWYFVKLYNKRPGNVYYSISTMDTPTASLNPNESFSFDMRR